MLIGITGSLCSGKSTISGILKKKGARIFNADKRIHELYRDRSSSVYKKTVKAFPGVVTPSGRISRKRLGSIVFSYASSRRRLERIVHPVVISQLRSWANVNRNKGDIYAAEIPLLFERNLGILFHKIILVYAPKVALIHRIKTKFSLTSEEASSRLMLFSPWKEKKVRADFIINNASDIRTLKRKVGLLWQKLKKMS